MDVSRSESSAGEKQKKSCRGGEEDRRRILKWSMKFPHGDSRPATLVFTENEALVVCRHVDLEAETVVAILGNKIVIDTRLQEIFSSG